MAGKIPGLEVARRRRFHGWSDSSFTINSALGYTRSRVSYHTHLTSTPCSHRSSDEDGKLGCVARKAKQRLDGKLRGHWKSEISSQEKSEIETKPSNCMEVGDMQMEIFGLKKNGSKRFSWGILGLNWKSSDQNECAVCLEKFKFNEKLTRMPCAHRFHSMCLLPWLKSNAHCPCCRTSVLGSN
ncbi:putative RING-H2 finger protein ATL71 [Lactuca sativa]|uniref:RING-type domain-containing protein n=1 Tax=Lactuca sativa TaxID=4236 RepID=A0A9R1VIZ0_LACSA|nr:putative RING-H2 finger protein ATL71 [Lactuca sativa]KAJ0205893.1 hypothetical protein LSAT_V11C500261930 [Lactuca sativa]